MQSCPNKARSQTWVRKLPGVFVLVSMILLLTCLAPSDSTRLTGNASLATSYRIQNIMVTDELSLAVDQLMHDNRENSDIHAVLTVAVITINGAMEKTKVNRNSFRMTRMCALCFRLGQTMVGTECQLKCLPALGV